MEASLAESTSTPTADDRRLFDYDHADFDNPKGTMDIVHRVNPHRGDMVQLSGVAWWDEVRGVGWRDVKEDEFWVPGHIPGRPLFPGVLQIEAGAQLSSFVMTSRLEEASFLGFTRVTDCSFRGQVVPGDTLILCTKEVKVNRRRFITDKIGRAHV